MTNVLMSSKSEIKEMKASEIREACIFLTNTEIEEAVLDSLTEKNQEKRIVPVLWTILKGLGKTKGLMDSISIEIGVPKPSIRAVIRGLYQNEKVTNYIKDYFLNNVETAALANI